MAEISPRTAALLEELRGKGILREENFLTLSKEGTEANIRYELLGILDAQADGNRITRQDVDRYLEQLGFTSEETDRLRTSLREKQASKRNLN